jgi:hypothetical protein
VTRKPIPSGDTTFTVYWPDGGSADQRRRCDLSAVTGLLHIDRCPLTNRLRVRFPEPFADLVLVKGERVTTRKAERIFAAVDYLDARFTAPTCAIRKG